MFFGASASRRWKEMDDIFGGIRRQNEVWVVGLDSTRDISTGDYISVFGIWSTISPARGRPRRISHQRSEYTVTVGPREC